MSAIDTVKESDGELVLNLDTRVGASPYFCYRDGEWDVISLMYQPTENYTKANPEVRTVKAEPDVTEDQLREWVEANGEPYTLLSYDDSPFPIRDSYPLWSGADE